MALLYGRTLLDTLQERVGDEGTCAIVSVATVWQADGSASSVSAAGTKANGLSQPLQVRDQIDAFSFIARTPTS